MSTHAKIHYRGYARWTGDTRALCGTRSVAIRHGHDLTNFPPSITCTRCRVKLSKLHASPAAAASHDLPR